LWPHQGRPSARDSWLRTKALGRQLTQDALELSRRATNQRTKVSLAEHVATPAIRKPAADAYPYDVDAATWGMPRMSKTILFGANLKEVVDSRRRNYQTLSNALVSDLNISPLRRTLPDGTCPWGLPVILRRRAERDYLIRSRGVPVSTFGEVLHPLLFEQHMGEATMIDAAKFLSENVLAFAIHQGLSRADIVDYAATINAFVSGLSRL
jgi:dTDP-4-amino-4,6-dideoxygalactose transaminase